MAITSETIRKLSLLNLSTDQMIGVLSILYEDIDKEEERKKKQAYRKRMSRDSHRTVTGQSQDTPLNGFNGFPHPSLTSLNPLKEKPPKGGKKKNPNLPPGFLEFWQHYPKQRAGNCEKAEAAYQQALKRSTAEEILAGVLAYRESDEVREGFAKGAAAWLNDDRWGVDYKIHAGLPSENFNRAIEEQTERMMQKYAKPS